jgi:MarR-like DNA-binding transcriptional regulator SgrR of sgrS sRNA
MVQEIVQLNPRHEEYYYVSAERPTEVANYKFSFLKRIMHDEEENTKVEEENIFKMPERKDITKTLDQALTHRQLTLTLKIINYLETSLRLSIKRIDVKMGSNKSKEPFLMSILKLVNGVSYRFFEVANIRRGHTINIHNFLEAH